MQGKDSLDAFVIDDSADGKCFVDSAAFTGDYGARKCLHAYFFALFYGAADIYGIAYFKVRNLVL